MKLFEVTVHIPLTNVDQPFGEFSLHVGAATLDDALARARAVPHVDVVSAVRENGDLLLADG